MGCYHILVGYLRLGLVLLALFSWMSWMPWAREPTVCFAVSTFFRNESADAEIDGNLCILNDLYLERIRESNHLKTSYEKP